jgi:predicted house-cleaning noncanonical NTP pyrophosphatase (MazG superfamily)
VPTMETIMKLIRDKIAEIIIFSCLLRGEKTII